MQQNPESICIQMGDCSEWPHKPERASGLNTWKVQNLFLSKESKRQAQLSIERMVRASGSKHIWLGNNKKLYAIHNQSSLLVGRGKYRVKHTESTFQELANVSEYK